MKVLKQVKSLTVCALVACGAVPAVFGTWTHSGNYLVKYDGDGNVTWKIAVNTSAAGPLTISADGVKGWPATPDYTESNGTGTYNLDLNEPIDDGSYITKFSAYAFRRTGCPFLHRVVIPETLQTMDTHSSAQMFGSQSYLVDMPNAFPPTVKTVPKALFQSIGAGKFDVTLLSDELTSLSSQMFNAWRGTNVYFGVSVNSFGAYFFQSCSGHPFCIKFFGDPPTSFDGNFATQTGVSAGALVLCYPKDNAAWQAYVAENTTAPTTAQLNNFRIYYPAMTGAEPTMVITASPWKSTGGGAFAVPFDPWASDDPWSPETWLRIEGSEGKIMGGQNLVKPEYGIWMRSQFGGPVMCTAPSVKCTYQGDDYVCKGYSLQRYVDGAWQEFAKGDVNSVQIDDTVASGQSLRLVWQWVPDRRYRLDLHEDLLIDGGVTLTASPLPDEEGLYAAGTVVTLTANDGTAEGWGAFGAWQGDVGTANKWAGERVLEVPMNAHKSIYCSQRWVLSGNTITDGRWTLACSANSAKEITISSDCVRTKGNIPTIDLKKPVADGYKIVQINAYAFRSNNAGQSYSTFYFPDTVRAINNGAAGMFAGVNVSSVYNTFPDCLESFGGGMGGVVSGFRSDPLIKLLNKNLTTVPGQMFGMCNGGHTYHLGVGFTKISDYGFDCYSSGGLISIYFYGDTKTTFGTSWNRGSGAVRLVVPKTSADWKAWIAAGNVTLATDSSRATYNSTFPNQEPGEKFIGVCKNVDGLNGVYLCTWPSPAAKQFKILLK